jgi:hypothetical protein
LDVVWSYRAFLAPRWAVRMYFVYCKRLVRCLLVRRPTRKGGGEGQRLLNNIFLSRLGAQRASGNRCASGCWRRCARLEAGAGGWTLEVGRWTLEVGGGWPSRVVLWWVTFSTPASFPGPPFPLPEPGAAVGDPHIPIPIPFPFPIPISSHHLPIPSSTAYRYSYCTVAAVVSEDLSCGFFSQ